MWWFVFVFCWVALCYTVAGLLASISNKRWRKKYLDPLFTPIAVPEPQPKGKAMIRALDIQGPRCECGKWMHLGKVFPLFQPEEEWENWTVPETDQELWIVEALCTGWHQAGGNRPTWSTIAYTVDTNIEPVDGSYPPDDVLDDELLDGSYGLATRLS